MSFVVLLLLLSVPIFSLVFLFGGIEVDQVLYTFLVILVAALTMGVIGIAFSTWFRRSLAATVAAYVSAFVLLFGTVAFGLIFPTSVDPNATKAPAAPAITYLSPFVSLLWLAGNNQFPIASYGVRYSNGAQLQNGGTFCQSTANGTTFCSSTSSSAPLSSASFGPANFQQGSNAATIPSGLFEGWQPWQATITMQLGLCLIALLASAYLLPPVRRLPWRRRNKVAPATE
jgi:ABC-type transport system involved in multi-copper enzyme maturation permease subunit